MLRIDPNRIRLLMAERKCTVKALAELIAMDSSNLSRVLVRGKCHPITAARVAEGLGVPVAEIILRERVE